jgi:hypothetical protein
MGTPGFWGLDFVLRPTVGVEFPKKVFTAWVRWMSLIVELNASANMFYLLKQLLLLNLGIFKLKCNNLTFNELLSLYASYVCLWHSRFLENHPIWILEDGPLISGVILSHSGGTSMDSTKTSSGHIMWNLCFCIRWDLWLTSCIPVHPWREMSTHYFSFSGAWCGFHNKCARTHYTELAFLLLVGFAGHVEHSSVSGVWSVIALFSMLGWDWYRFNKKCTRTHYVELVFLQPVGSVSHVVHSGM